MKRIIVALLWCSALAASAQGYVRPHNEVKPVPTEDVAISTGQFEATEESLSGWECPEWFRDAKFGIWAHWGPQCQAEFGDWYARSMYIKGDGKFNYHRATFGDQSKYGFKEMIRDFTAPDWNPDALVALYKSVGARYFMALGNHHDNFDLWDSPYQEWNSVNLGPGKDVIKGWADACKKYGLKLGVSFHSSHAWVWYEPIHVSLTAISPRKKESEQGGKVMTLNRFMPRTMPTVPVGKGAERFTANGTGATESAFLQPNTCRISRTVCSNASTPTVPT